MSSSIELNQENCVDILKRYIDLGYKSTGSVTIKEGATLHKYFRFLKGQEKIEGLNKNDVFKIIFKVVEVFNSNKSYSLDDAAVIDKVITYLENEVIEKEEKIKEV